MESARKRILVIEDELAIRNLYAKILQDEVDVECASDGQSGFRRAVQEDFDLIIVDLMMVPWNGAESLAAIEMIKPQARFMVVSGYLDDPRFDAILNETKNVVQSVRKPFDITRLREIVMSILSPQAV